MRGRTSQTVGKIIKTLRQEVMTHLRNRKDKSEDLGVYGRGVLQSQLPQQVTGTKLCREIMGKVKKKQAPQNCPTQEPRNIRYLCNRSQCHWLRIAPGRQKMDILISQNSCI